MEDVGRINEMSTVGAGSPDVLSSDKFVEIGSLEFSEFAGEKVKALPSK